MKTIDTRNELAALRTYFARRVAEEKAAGRQGEGPITAIEVGLRLCQAGYVLLHFDRREPHERDGEWTSEMEPESNMQKVTRWWKGYESVEENDIRVILPDGSVAEMLAGSGDEVSAGAFGEALWMIVVDAVARGTFAGLDLAPACQLDIDEFDGMWAWPDADELGSANLVAELPAARLPE